MDLVFMALGMARAAASPSLMLLSLILGLVVQGAGVVDVQFLTNFPSRKPEQAGILSAWVGSAAVMLVTACLALPLGVGAGIYLEEYAPKNWLTDIIEVNVTNLAGVPSIIYGLLALGLFLFTFGMGQWVAVAGLVLALLILPVVIVATRESFRSIPGEVREAAHALGANDWQTVSRYLMPAAWPGILTGLDRRAVARHRRDRAGHHHRCADLHRLPAASADHVGISILELRVADRAVHRHADPDVQLGLSASVGVPRSGCRRRIWCLLVMTLTHERAWRSIIRYRLRSVAAADDALHGQNRSARQRRWTIRVRSETPIRRAAYARAAERAGFRGCGRPRCRSHGLRPARDRSGRKRSRGGAPRAASGESQRCGTQLLVRRLPGSECGRPARLR
ncbi:MAG: ABC transporter permease subunit [Halofilum sp. (in: g-proteobacteria)]|nr:ABC transporter permease subunit [Halofilum sp. (in: g-proteobacteria)]